MGTSVVQPQVSGVFSNGPWKSVRNTPEPFANSPDQLVAATNIYLADTENGSGAYARWGYSPGNASVPFADGGQLVFSHTDSTGTSYTFAIAGGHMYRASGHAVFATWTDVTPTAFGIGQSSLVFALSTNGYLVINDESNKPWIASSLSSTPIVQTAIDFDGAGTVWRAVGQPVEYGGSVVFALASVNSVACPTDIAWSAPGTPATGYEQNPYDFRWTLLASGSGAINALCATNLALYYFRDYSIGVLTGTPATAGSTSGSDFRNSATHDAISADVGCNASRTIQQYGTNILFMDVLGRPWLLPIGPWQQQIGTTLVPIWEQMRAVLATQAGDETVQTGQPNMTRLFACSCIWPSLGLYLCCNYTSRGSGLGFTYPTSLAVFDAKTGAYEGQWYIGTGLTIQAIGTIIGSAIDTGAAVSQNMIIGGSSATLPDAKAYSWISGGSIWVDLSQGSFVGGQPDISITTPRFGFDARSVQNVDRVTAITGLGIQVAMTVSTPVASQTIQPTPVASTDGTYRCVGGVNIMGRGITVKVAPRGSGSAQWSCQQVVAEGVQSLAGPDDA